MGYYEDEIYHSGYLDGYYAGMELYHADEEMTEEERKARRRKRRRNIALGVAGAAGVAGAGVAGYAIGRALRKRGRGIVPRGSSGSRGYIVPKGGPRLIGGPAGGPSGPRLIGGPAGGPSGPRGPRPTGPTLKRVRVPDYDVETPNGWDFRRNKPTYSSDDKKKKEDYEHYNNWMKRAIFDYDPVTKKMKRTIFD